MLGVPGKSKLAKLSSAEQRDESPFARMAVKPKICIIHFRPTQLQDACDVCQSMLDAFEASLSLPGTDLLSNFISRLRSHVVECIANFAERLSILEVKRSLPTANECLVLNCFCSVADQLKTQMVHACPNQHCLSMQALMKSLSDWFKSDRFKRTNCLHLVLTCWTGGLFCTQVATTSAARHLTEASGSCNSFSSVGRPPIVCKSAFYRSHVVLSYIEIVRGAEATVCMPQHHLGSRKCRFHSQQTARQRTEAVYMMLQRLRRCRLGNDACMMRRTCQDWSGADLWHNLCCQQCLAIRQACPPSAEQPPDLLRCCQVLL